MMSVARMLLFCLGGLFVGAVPCLAEDELSIGIGGAVGTTPYKQYDTQWMPFPFVSYEGEHSYIRGVAAGVKLTNLKFLEISVFAKYDLTHFDSSETRDKRLRRLKNRRSSAAFGLEARLLTPYGMLYVSGAKDVLGRSNGFTGAVGYMQSIEHGSVEFTPAVGTYWSSSKYNDYYYGVSGSEARKSGLDSYNAGAGFSPYVGLGLDYSITEHWDFFCRGEMVFLSGAVKDSPVVGKSRTQNLAFGITYTF